MIGRRAYLSTDTITKFYRLTKDYIIDNQLVDNDAKTLDFSQTNLFSINQSLYNLFDIYPLQNNVISLNGKRPIEFEIRNLSSLDKDRTFNFNPVSKKYAYVADGGTLVYDFNISDTGTIAMRAFTDVSEDKQYLFEGKDSNGDVIGLYRNKNHYLVVDVNGYKIESNLKFESNKWHSVGLSFKESVTASSVSTKGLDLRIVLDDKSWTYNKGISFSYNNLKFIIGRKFELEDLPMSFGVGQTYLELQGQIEMLATRPAYCELDTIDKLFDNLKSLTKVSEFDEFGMLKKVDIHECGKSILSNTYEFKTRSNDAKYISKQIKSEKIRFGTSIINRSYETDALGNITKISDPTFGNHTYEYDYRGFLINADGERYTYDGNGNITKKGSKALTYDSTIKDRLVSFNGKRIEYDALNPLNPKTYNGNTYEFEGRRLTRYIYSGGYYQFNYNYQGLRIRKQDYRGVGTDYIYDGNKLITEIGTNFRLDFLYDENGSLYGFIKDMSEKYLYIRDSMQNILGISDINGNLVVKYRYDAWGQILEVSGSNVSLGNLNPFKYKGYYYDSETGMYYCKSRYYVPEWGRWLNADNSKFLDPQNINKCNLFAYCCNNPINIIDDNGNWPKWAKWLLGGVLIASAVILTVATGGLGGAIASTLGGGLVANIVGGAVAGAVVGAASGALINAGTQIITKDIEDFSWKEVGYSALGGGISGAFAGGVFGGIKHVLSTGKIANALSKLQSAENRLGSSFNCLKNIDNFVGRPFGNSNIVSSIAQSIKNYNSAYISYISAKATYAFVELSSEIVYFGLESALSELISKLF